MRTGAMIVALGLCLAGCGAWDPGEQCSLTIGPCTESMYVAHGAGPGLRYVNLPSALDGRYAYINPKGESIAFCGAFHLMAVDRRRDDGNFGLSQYGAADVIEVDPGPHELLFEFSGWCSARSYKFEFITQAGHYYVPVGEKIDDQIWAWIEDRPVSGGEGSIVAPKQLPM